MQLGFIESVREFLADVECRLAESDDEREAIFRLRYAAYLREGAISPSDAPRFTDKYDDGPNAMTFGLYVDGSLASSIRLHIATREVPELPGLRVFADHLEPRLAAGQTIIDPTRFVVDLTSARLYPKLPYATVRVAWLASEHFGADLLLASVRVEHQAFYKRLFGHKVACPARPYPTLAKPISLMELDFPQERERVLRRYSFFESTELEREALFDTQSLRLRGIAGRKLPVAARTAGQYGAPAANPGDATSMRDAF